MTLALASTARPRLSRYLAALAIVAAATLSVEAIYRLFDTDRVAVVFLTGIVVAGVSLGTGPAYLAALVSALIHNVYLVEPRFRFGAFTNEDFIVLVMFVIVAVLTGRLTGRLHAAAAADRAEAQVKQLMFEAGDAFNACATEQATAEALCGRLVALTGQAAEVSVGDEVWRQDGPGAATPGEWRRREIAVADGPAWRIGWRRPVENAARLDGPAEILAELAAGVAARLRAAARRAELEAVTRTARLRDAVLSSVSHDLRTPLATILASASSLRAFGDRLPADATADLSATIEGEARRLNLYVDGLLDMTRLEAGAIDPDTHVFDVAEILDRCVRPLERDGFEVVRAWPQSALPVRADPALFEQALSNVLDNARKYAGGHGPITVSAAVENGMAAIEVADRGPGLADDEFERVFDKFHRAAAPARGVKGAGLGLSIARGFVEAMGGEAHARRGAAGGLVLRLTLPAGDAA